MKHCVPIVAAVLLLAASAMAQTTVELGYYQPDDQILTVNTNPGTILLTRFETQAPARLKQLSAWFYSAADGGDSAYIYLFGREGGAAFPYLLNVLISAKVWIPASTNALTRLNIDPPLTFAAPTSFFMGVQFTQAGKAFVRMDQITQTPSCVTTLSDFPPQHGDSLYTSSLLIVTPNGIATGAKFGDGSLFQNWYMGAQVEYFDASPETFFTDVTNTSKLSIGAGTNLSRRVAWADFNNDGLQDCLWGDHLFKNNGNGTFTDVSTTLGYTDGDVMSMFIDVDNDADLDIVCVPNANVYINNTGSFTLNNATGLLSGPNPQAMAAADYDKDGFLDMFIAYGEYMYVKNPTNPSDSALVRGAAAQGYFFKGAEDAAFFNDNNTLGNGAFAVGNFGSDPYNPNTRKNGYRPVTCVQWADYNSDGYPDLYMGVNRQQPNYVWRNGPSQTLLNNALTVGLAGLTIAPNPTVNGNTMGCDWGDYDNDGDMDLITSETAYPFRLTTSAFSAVYENINGQFNAIPPATSKFFYTDLNSGDIAWGDYNNDGLLDFVQTSGDNCFLARFYEQNPDHTFTNKSYYTGIEGNNSQGLAWVDYDNDGDLDVSLVSNLGIRLYRNDAAGAGNWVKVSLDAKTSNRFAVGGRVYVHVGNTTYLREVTAGRGAGSQNPYVQHIGIGGATAIDSIRVKWPNDKWQTLKNPAINTLHGITEETVSVPSTAAARSLELKQNYPNPFSQHQSTTTSIAYNLPGRAAIKVEIYDAKGAVVKTLVDKVQEPGTYYLQWDGRDTLGQPVPSGSYQYVLTSDGSVLSKRMVVIK